MVLVHLIYHIILIDIQYIVFIPKAIWTILIDYFFNSGDPDFHSLFYKIFLLVVRINQEKVIINLIFSNNVLT